MHEHDNEYRVRIVHEDQTEELSGWMASPEQVAQAIAALRGSAGKAYWLQTCNVSYLNGWDRDLTIVECRLILTVAKNPRYPNKRTEGASTTHSDRIWSFDVAWSGCTVPRCVGITAHPVGSDRRSDGSQENRAR